MADKSDIASLANPEVMELPGALHPFIMVMGETGAGKSHFIKTIAPGSNVKEGHTYKPCTQESEAIQVKVGKVDVLLIDTPGFNDAYRSDADILLDVSYTLTALTRAKAHLKGILYMTSLRMPRMSGSAMRQLQLLRKICGEDQLKNVYFVTTNWDNGDNEWYPAKEKELKNEFLAPMLGPGKGTMHRFLGTTLSAKGILSQMLHEDDVILDLQQEILLKGRKLDQTSAGTFAIEARYQLGKEFESNLLETSSLNQAKTDHMEKVLKVSKWDKMKLQTDVVGDVDKEIEKKLRTKPTMLELLGWVITLGSFAINLAATIASGGF